jgi:hypothetical protein
MIAATLEREKWDTELAGRLKRDVSPGEISWPENC